MSLKLNLTIDQGADYLAAIHLTDQDDNSVDLSAFTCAAKMRHTYTSNTAYTFDVNVDTSNSIINMTMNHVETANIAAGKYVYDLELTNSTTNTVVRLFEGIVTVGPQVTT